MATKCTICETRPVMTSARKREHGVDFDYCEPCLGLAEWENIHSDYAHEALAVGPNGTEGIVDESGYALDDCWICHPENDRTRVEYVERRGTSRAGMVITIPPKEAGVTKANSLIQRFQKAGFATDIRTRKGIVTMKVAASTGTGAVLNWDTKGPYLSGRVTVDGRERGARNVSEALRLLAV